LFCSPANDERPRFVAVLGIPPVESAETVVIASLIRPVGSVRLNSMRYCFPKHHRLKWVILAAAPKNLGPLHRFNSARIIRFEAVDQ
jgi:hypothetical protein